MDTGAIQQDSSTGLIREVIKMNQKEILGGCICVIVTMLLMTCLVFYLNQSEDPESFQAGLSINNITGYDIEARIYVHGDSNWDTIHVQISNNTQEDLVVKWEGKLTDVLVLYDIEGETKAFIYYLEPTEWRIVVLV